MEKYFLCRSFQVRQSPPIYMYLGRSVAQGEKHDTSGTHVRTYVMSRMYPESRMHVARAPIRVSRHAPSLAIARPRSAYDFTECTAQEVGD